MRVFFVTFALVAVACGSSSKAPGSGTPVTNPASGTCVEGGTCAGCCDTDSICRDGTLDVSCGAPGHACENCTAVGLACVNGACGTAALGSSSGDASSGSGSGSGGGRGPGGSSSGAGSITSCPMQQTCPACAATMACCRANGMCGCSLGGTCL